VSEHGWPGWPDGHDGPDPHDNAHEHPDVGGDHVADDAGVWTPDGHWDPTHEPVDHPAGDTPAEHADPDAPDDGWAGHDPGHAAFPDDRLDHGVHPDDPGDHAAAGVETHPLGPVGTDPDAAPDHDLGGEPVFPPAVDVGVLPEPVDGFPWIDTGTLGVVPVDLPHPAAAADPADLAAYAAADLPPGVDPWAALADSDDPATSALARFWAPDEPT
jgi:hypothetical protein